MFSMIGVAHAPVWHRRGCSGKRARIPGRGMRTVLLVLVAVLSAQRARAQHAVPDMEFGGHAFATGRDVAALDAMAGMDMTDHAGTDGHERHMAMRGAFGPYPMTREASGTSWQPDASTHDGLHLSAGGWQVMVHGFLNGVYTNQTGRRGDDKAFLAGHVMGMAARDVSARDRVQFRLAVSPDPFMGASGYPLLLASGETADGRNQLIDRQHPHDLFSELSASLSHGFGKHVSGFIYFGLPGEPAFGPPAYLHRQSIMDDPEAPISHHWLDSTHVSEGVMTAGLVAGAVKLEASRFRGREPDQHRYDIEAPGFDSTAARLSWNPARTLSLQASWADQRSPEQLNPAQDQERWSASAIYTRPLGRGFWASTFAWGRRIDKQPGTPGRAYDAFVLETALHPDTRWTVFARAERVTNPELLLGPGGADGPVFTVGKLSGGAVRDFAIGPHLAFGAGAVVSRSLVPAGLGASYDGDRWSGTGFVRVKLR